jgi:hypothetical protein
MLIIIISIIVTITILDFFIFEISDLYAFDLNFISSLSNLFETKDFVVVIMSLSVIMQVNPRLILFL